GFVKKISCPTDTAAHCRRCEGGKEYMDHINDSDKCLRCSSCDRILGFEVGRNCTSEENTECTCAENYFCNSTLPCQHCHPCTTCESGVIETPCTLTSNTVCRIEGTTLKKKQTKNNKTKPKLKGAKSSDFSLLLLDIDLSSHVTGIAEEMTLQEVLKFVRYHQVPEPVIDQTLRDNFNDTSEQKIKLFGVWYQRHGIKGAYGTLIGSLRELKMCAVADKIEGKLKAAAPSRQEGGQPCSSDAEHSQACTQEHRNSNSDSTELHKTFSGLLEET
ncbi:TNR6 factor, partial [Rostratula benghalensis]|nr:TNR6 factor [Rostratula benghalensis]